MKRVDKFLANNINNMQMHGSKLEYNGDFYWTGLGGDIVYRLTRDERAIGIINGMKYAKIIDKKICKLI